MGIYLRILCLTAVTMVFGLHRAFAADPGVRGTVLGNDGRPLPGVEVRADRVDGKAPVVIGKTDSKGHYALTGLKLGTYKLTTLVNRVPQSSATLKTKANKWVRIDFNFAAMQKVAGAKMAGAKRKKHYVYVSGETGTHIGGGHWEEVDDSGNSTGSQPVERVSGSSLNRPQSSFLNPSGGSAGPGH